MGVQTFFFILDLEYFVPLFPSSSFCIRIQVVVFAYIQVRRVFLGCGSVGTLSLFSTLAYRVPSNLELLWFCIIYFKCCIKKMTGKILYDDILTVFAHYQRARKVYTPEVGQKAASAPISFWASQFPH